MTPFRTGCALVALIIATPALAQTGAPAPSDADLAALVRAQAAEIATLKSRLDRLETNAVVAQAAAPAAPVQPTAAAPQPQLAQTGEPRRTVPFAPQLAPPGPADRSVAQAVAARDNPSGLTTEWGASCGLPLRGRRLYLQAARPDPDGCEFELRVEI
jgi:phosphate-selective porin OprO/OprP